MHDTAAMTAVLIAFAVLLSIALVGAGVVLLILVKWERQRRRH